MKIFINFTAIVIITFNFFSCKKESPVQELPGNAVDQTQLKEVNACTSPPQILAVTSVGGAEGFGEGKKVFLFANKTVGVGGSFKGIIDIDPGPGIKNVTSDGYYDPQFWYLSDASGFHLLFDRDGKFISSQKTRREKDALDPRDVYGNRFSVGTEDLEWHWGDSESECMNLIAKNYTVFKISADSKKTLWAKMFAFDDRSKCKTLFHNIDASGNVIVNFGPDWHKYSPAGTHTLFSLAANSSMSPFWLDKQGNIYGRVYYDKLRKYDGKTHKMVWEFTDGGIINDLGFDDIGNVYLTGFFTGTRDFDPGAGKFNMTASGYTIFLSKISPSGKLMWASQLGPGHAYGVTPEADGKRIYITGSLHGTQTYSTTTGPVTVTSKGGTDAFIMALKQCN